MSAERDGRRTSPALTHARSVRSRAASAIEDYEFWGQMGDPAGDEILRALETVVRVLEPYKRTGTTKRE